MRAPSQIKPFILIIWLSTYTQIVEAQSFHFTLFDPQDGLYSPEVNTLFQDSRGQLWVGTTLGLNLYDGYEFHKIALENRLPSGKINQIIEDEWGGIWLAMDRGLGFIRNRRIYKWGEKDSLLQGKINKLYLDVKGNLWMASPFRLSCMPHDKLEALHSGKIETPSFEHIMADTLSKEIFDLEGDEEGNIYIGTFTSLLRYNSKDGFQLISASGEREAMPTVIIPLGKDSLIWAVHEGNIYQSIRGKRETLFYSYFHMLRNPDILPLDDRLWGVKEGEIPQYEGDVRNTWIEHLDALTETWEVIITDTVIWVADGGGLYKIKKDRVVHYRTPQEWDLKLFNCMILDMDGNFWLGSTEGLVKASPQKFNFYQSWDKDERDLYAMIEDDQGRLILGGNQGQLFMYEKGKFYEPYDILDILPAGEIFDIIKDHKGSFWFASYWRGIAHLLDGKINRYLCDNAFNNCLDIYCLYESHKQDIWVGTWMGLTRLIMDWEADTIKEIIHYWEKEKPQFEVYTIVEDNYGTLWIGTDKGLFYFDGVQIKAYTPLKDTAYSPIASLKIDRENHLWLATQGSGIYNYKIQGEKDLKLKQQFTTKDGLASNILLSLEFDQNEHVWVSSYEGLTSLKKTGLGYHISNYNAKDGLIDKAYQKLKLFRDSKGIMWGASTMGLFSFEPEKLTIEQRVLETSIAEISFSGQKIKPEKSGEIPDLNWDQNLMEVEFIAVNLSNPSKTRYSWRLKGLNDSWSPPNENRKLRFTNLAPGSYSFQVKAANADGVWNEKVTHVEFSIDPPFWQSWWFIMLSVTTAILASYSYIIDRDNRLRKQEAEKSRINQLISELETRALRAQMNPHFIFNAINAISEAILSKEIKTAYTYLFKFSQLLRAVLNSSSKGKISVETEVEMLELFLELESLRFDQSFHYKITVAADEEIEDILIPSLMIQPFVENAIWHGLLPKKGDRSLKICFFIEEDSLICTIEDNGIGREKAKKALNKKRLKHQPMAMHLIKERLRFIREKSQHQAFYEVYDLKDKVGKALGTQVKICLPIDWENY